MGWVKVCFHPKFVKKVFWLGLIVFKITGGGDMVGPSANHELIMRKANCPSNL